MSAAGAPARQLAAPALALSALVCCLWGLLLAIRYHLPLPIRDEVELNLRVAEWPLWDALWAPIVDHIVAPLQLLIAADTAWLGGNGWLVSAGTLVSIAVLPALAFAAAGRAGGDRWLAALVAAAGLLAPVNLPNLAWPLMAHLHSALALVLLAGHLALQAEAPGPRRLAAAAIGLLLAPLSFGAGLVGGPLLLLFAWLRRARVSVALVLAVATLAGWLLFFWLRAQGGTAERSPPLDFLLQPLLLAEYLLRFFAEPPRWLLDGPLGGSVARPGSLALTAIALMAWAWATLRALRRRRLRPGLPALGWLAAGLALGSAALAGLGRLDSGVLQAASPRYATVALLFWTGGALWLLGIAAPHPRPRAALHLGLALVIALAIGAGDKTRRHWIAGRHAEVHDFASLLLSGVGDAATMAPIHPDPARLERLYALRRQQGLAPFDWAVAATLGRPVDLARGAPDCTGGVLGERAAEDGGRVLRGWVGAVDGATVERILLLRADGTVAGLGWPLRPGRDPAVPPALRHEARLWIAFGPPGALAVRALLDDGGLCRLADLP